MLSLSDKLGKVFLENLLKLKSEYEQENQERKIFYLTPMTFLKAYLKNDETKIKYKIEDFIKLKENEHPNNHIKDIMGRYKKIQKLIMNGHFNETIMNANILIDIEMAHHKFMSTIEKDKIDREKVKEKLGKYNYFHDMIDTIRIRNKIEHEGKNASENEAKEVFERLKILIYKLHPEIESSHKNIKFNIDI